MAAVAALKPKVEVHAIAALRREHARRQRLPARRHLGLARRQDRRDHQHRRRGPPRAGRRARVRARRSRPTCSSTTRRSPGACVVALGTRAPAGTRATKTRRASSPRPSRTSGESDVAHAAARGAARADQERRGRREADGRSLRRLDHRGALSARVRRATPSGSTATSPGPRPLDRPTAWMQAKGAHRSRRAHVPRADRAQRRCAEPARLRVPRVRTRREEARPRGLARHRRLLDDRGRRPASSWP